MQGRGCLLAAHPYSVGSKADLGLRLLSEVCGLGYADSQSSGGGESST